MITTTNVQREVLDISEAADLLRVSTKTVRVAISRGELPVVQIGRRRVVRRRDLDAYLDARLVGASPTN
jgi:excisionase family DNA binding protein